jgi:hypothetical protein
MMVDPMRRANKEQLQQNPHFEENPVVQTYLDPLATYKKVERIGINNDSIDERMSLKS